MLKRKRLCRANPIHLKTMERCFSNGKSKTIAQVCAYFEENLRKSRPPFTYSEAEVMEILNKFSGWQQDGDLITVFTDEEIRARSAIDYTG